MYLPDSYTIAMILMFITMLCWGSWANTQKLAKSWRFELFYWDYTIGVLLTGLLLAFTLGSMGDVGLPFLADLSQTRIDAKWQAFFSGVIFNVGNILLVAAIAIAGMAVAFPIGIGIALVLGTALSYVVEPQGHGALLLIGVGLVFCAILLDAKAYKKATHGDAAQTKKGIWLSVISGLLIGTFYPLIAKAMSGDHAAGPYSAMVCFSVGIVVCNLPFNALLMKKPITGAPVSFKSYFKGSIREHAVGLLGGFIWMIGMGLNLIAASKAGPAIAYAFGQGATLIAAIWGVFIWREFKGVAGVRSLLTWMFICYVLGLGFIGFAKLAV